MSRKNSSTFILLFLATLTAFGPFVTDMYLPTLPEMVTFFHTSSSLVQLGLTTSMVGLAAGQLFFGPLSDKYGRRPLLIAGMCLFLLATAGCLYSSTIMQFVGWRLVQGIGGASGIVISRSVAADKYSGRELVKMLAIIGAINGIAPVAAPIGGGVLAEHIGWQGIFWVLLILGIILLTGCFHFVETLLPERRDRQGWTHIIHNFGTVLHNRLYVCYILQFAFSQGVLFAHIASAPFIMQTHYSFSPMLFSFCFGLNALAIVVAAALSARFRHPELVLYRGSQAMLVLALLLLVALGNHCGFWVYEILLIGLLVTLGFSFTSSNALALNAERTHSGTASALLGALGFASGGLVSPLVGIGDILLSTGIVFTLAALGALICARLSLQGFIKRGVQVKDPLPTKRRRGCPATNHHTPHCP